jgi:hypothetical protein
MELLTKNKKNMQLNEFKDKLGDMLGDKHINIPSGNENIYNRVSDGLNYFKMGFLEELTTDKRYYVEAFIEYIERVEGFKKKEGF